MSNIDSVEEIRLQNLKLLHGLSSERGAPTSRGFSSYLGTHGVRISQPELSDLYRRKKPINSFLAREIERGFGLPDGWFSHNQHIFWRSLSPKDMLITRKFSKLPEELKIHVSALIEALEEKMGET